MGLWEGYNEVHANHPKAFKEMEEECKGLGGTDS